MPIFSWAQVAFGFIENKGQWEQDYDFRLELPGAIVYLEGSSVLFDTWDQALQGAYYHRAKFGEDLSGFPSLQQRHAYRQKFIGATKPSYIPGNASQEHYNFFVNPNPEKWVSELKKYQFLTLKDLYAGVDLVYTIQNFQLKYDLHVAPNTDISKIRWEYDGIEKISIRDGAIMLKTALGEIQEAKPIAWQYVNGERVNVPVEYKKFGKELGYFFPESYRKDLELIIDPLMIFTTYVGSVSDSWGYTATPGGGGTGYSGGIVFGSNYPTTLGAYQTSWGAGGVDAVISKFSSNGTTLLYSTFLGGNGPDMPHSIIEAENGELYILGSTGSNNFPTTPGAYDNSFNNGPNINFFNGLINYPSGVDIFISRLSANGNALLSSTYLGGSGNDGLNLSIQLSANYADEFRGEIILDASNNVYIASVTNSTNFPTVAAFQNTLGGGYDAIFARFTPDLQSLVASSYFGGSGDDAAYSIQRAKSGLIYFTGGTTSTNLTTTPGVIQPFALGNTDGFLVRLNPAGTALQAATYIGTPVYNQTYFVQLDTNDNVYVMGQTQGVYPVQAAAGLSVYSVAGAGQFIHKLNPTLTTTLMSTTFGSGPGVINLVPSAFLLHDCNQIYIAGWGGTVNQQNGGIGGTTLGLPTTPGAYKPTTNGNDFYLAVFEQDAQSLLYATFMGGNQSNNHVDGGTSRFDKAGVVYQAMCASCGGLDDLPTTPGAYSSTNNSTNCNIALVKFDVSVLTAYLNASTTTVCEGAPVTFQNQSNGGVSFTWHFGDGTTQNSVNATHTYNTPGTYNVMLIASDPQNCVVNDTAFVTITVNPKPIASVVPVTPICPTTSVQLTASGGVNYQWLPAPGLPTSGYNIANPTVTPPQTTTYTVIASNNCGLDTALVTVPVIDFSVEISDTDTICIGNTTQLQSSGGISYSWSPATGLSNPNIPNPVAQPMVSTIYVVTVQNPDGCVLKDSVYIQVDNPSQTDAGPDTLICLGDQIQLNVVGATHFTWTPPTYLNNPNISNPICKPETDIQYIIAGKNACGFSYDTLQINVKTINPISGPDTLVCPGSQVRLYTSGGVEYQWFPHNMVDTFNIQSPLATIPHNVNFVVYIKDSIGCTTTDTVTIHTYDIKDVSAGPDRYIEFGESTILQGDGPSDGVYQWIPPTGLSCSNCTTPIASPRITTTYGLVFVDNNGCYFIDSVTVFVLGNIYVPNTITLDHNGLNEIFYAYGVDIEKFEMVVFNRWGEVIYKTDDFNKGWDGHCKGVPCKQDTYVYRILYTEKHGREGEIIGHVNLLR